MPQHSHDVAVIGGGMIGAATAYYLSGYGARTILLERGRLGAEASGRNAGTLNLLNDRATVYHGVDLKLRAMRCWRSLSEELGHDLDVDVDKGTLLVAEQPTECDRLRVLQAGHQANGVPIEWHQGNDLLTFAPYLSPSVSAAIYCPIGGSANPLLAAWAYAQAARRRGAQLQERTEVTAIVRDGQGYCLQTRSGRLRAGTVVLAAGPWTMKMAAALDVSIPLKINYFQVSVTDAAPGFLRHGLRRVAGRLTLKQTARGHCILGGGWPGISAFPVPGRISPHTIAANCAVAVKLVPGLARLSILRSWAGYDGSTTDERPILDEAPGWPGLFISTGSSTGFADGPVLGELTAQRVLGQPLAYDISPFTLARFSHVPQPG